MKTYVPTKADEEVADCLMRRCSFSVIAGAGSGKTTSLVQALKWILNAEGDRMRRDGQNAVCITYTNRAADVINERLRQNPLFVISTLHSFLWSELRHFPKSIREALRRCVIPEHIAKCQEADNGGESKKARDARASAVELENALEQLDTVKAFHYGDDTPFSNYLKGEIGHDDLLRVAANVIHESMVFRRILGQKYPYVFVDEAQDTSAAVVDAFNTLCADAGLPIVGYFGDPMQQIYDKGVGAFTGPTGSAVITKVENFRSAPQIVALLNAFRTDVRQVATGDCAVLNGSVQITLVEAEKPEEKRGRYSDEQLERASERLRNAIDAWGWTQNVHAKQLFLVRRMIARRIGFLTLHDLFTGPYASTRAQNEYEDGKHFLIRPFIETIVPLVKAHREGNASAVMRVLTSRTPAFEPEGLHASRSIAEVREVASKVISALAELFASNTLGDVLRYCQDQGLIRPSGRLSEHLNREPLQEKYNPEVDVENKANWLVDAFVALHGSDIEHYYDFFDENTPYSTQHGAKGEEYDDVLVVFDDVEAAWNNYNFAKLLTPKSAGEAKESQSDRTRKLAYVCFSRAIKNLRIVLFTPNPQAAARELIDAGLFQESQVTVQ